ncbi:MAG: sigma-70 family RNA polymerase sigma factor [Prevotellaceae bacterium]|jgi:RNA polymerase sigma-70 factor (ECF subfamily)|nr:sigma-70 family RNA polymerase sigma factor [Prevotellaceae bacterium]
MENNELIDELYRKYYKYLLYIAKKIVPEANAEDIVSEVFLKLMESPQWLDQCKLKLECPDELKRILRAFLHNACTDYCKHSNITHKIFKDIPELELLAISIDMEQKYEDRDLFEHIINTPNRLSERGKNVFFKYHIEGYLIKELAEQTGLSPRTIETYVYRALEYFRKIFKK